VLNVLPSTMDQDEWDKLDRRDRSTIRLCLSNSVLMNVLVQNIAKILWAKIIALYKTVLNKLFLKRNMYSLKMHEGYFVTKHLNDLHLVVIWLVSIDVSLSFGHYRIPSFYLEACLSKGD